MIGPFVFMFGTMFILACGIQLGRLIERDK